jgi:hypothetical protein
MDAATLRNLDQLDSEALKALILALHEQVFAHQKQLSTRQEKTLSQREQLASRDAEIEHLKLLIAKLRRMQSAARGEAGSPDRTTGTAAGRTGSKTNETFRSGCGCACGCQQLCVSRISNFVSYELHSECPSYL